MIQTAGYVNEEVRGKSLGISDSHIYAFLSKYNYKLHKNWIKIWTRF